ncbi:MAG: leucyl aminopeptidase [Parvibaculaceae bacterium]|jgi:leucyl aminopeptidase
MIKISFADMATPKGEALLVLTGEGKTLSGVAADLDVKTDGALKRAAKAVEFSGKLGSTVDVVAPKGTTLTRIILMGAGKGADLDTDKLEKLGGKVAARLAKSGPKASVVIGEIKGLPVSIEEAAAHIGLGAKLRGYAFNKYKTKAKPSEKELASLVVRSAVSTKARRLFGPLGKVGDGVLFARELVNEPANVLFPAEFAARLKKLTDLGVKVEVLTEKQMARLGMGALLGVGQGSVRDSLMVVMHWNGGKKADQPIAFVGKGVCFDTGGISLKPGGGMEDMKGDMGGAACVSGLMHALAARKAKANVIGVVGLVENMPDANAQRPGDIVTSMSGQTIEVINTDAEGRLVLADALWYTQDRFKPKFMIDLATLTGAIMVALGQEYAGLFSNNDKLSEQLTEAGLETDEKVWRMPMTAKFDKMVDSRFADMKNVGSRYGGSITAAQFLQRYVNDTPWAHLDIAGTAMNSPKSDINVSWGSGYGVRLLNRLVEAHYEG